MLIHKFTRIMAAFLMFLFTLLTSCTPSALQYSVVFSAKLDGNQDLYRIQSTDFETIERLTFTPDEAEHDLKITKDGKRLLFSLMDPSHTWHPYIMDLKTKTATDISKAALGEYSPKALAWSSDERRVVLFDMSSLKSYTVDLNGGNLKELEIPHKFDSSIFTDINYSPDGQKIAYTEYHQPVPPLSTKSSFIFDFATKSVFPLISDATATCSDPEWSPTGKHILLSCDLSTDGVSIDSHLYVFEVIESNPFSIKETADLACGLDFAWSPKENQFASNCKATNDGDSLVIFDSNGRIAKKFPLRGAVGNPMVVGEITWSSDGQKILYVAGKDRNSLNIYMMDSDGSNNHAITTRSANYSELSVYALDP